MSDEPKTITDQLAEELGFPPRPADFGRRCDHGSLARSCQTCELIEAGARIAALEAAGDALTGAAMHDGRCCGTRYYTPDQHSEACEVARWLEVRRG